MQYPLLMLTAALLGGIAAFAYSYAPLHRAKDWQIDYLEARLESRTEQVTSLEEQLHEVQSSSEATPPGQEVAALRSQLDEAKALSGSLQEQVHDLERELAEMTRSRDTWQKKYADASREAEAARMAATPARKPAPAPEPDTAAPEPDTAEPAAPAAPAPLPDLHPEGLEG